MHRRSENIDDTILKIVEATVELHGTIGPSATTVMGIADKAGVTRQPGNSPSTAEPGVGRLRG